MRSPISPDAQALGDPEALRLAELQAGPSRWQRWGPYLAERQWGTVREDYSADGQAWDYFPHDHARSRAYRWGEDGLFGISDDHQRLCFALAIWNERDPILKERLFGLTGNEGNHGEDVKEYYYFLDSTPTHSYLKALYKYPQAAFPYADLVATSRSRSRHDPEYELLDTGVFDDDRYFDVVIEYGKVEAEDILVRISATNRGPEPAPLHLLPTLWFRNTWSWGRDDRRPELRDCSEAGATLVRATHRTLGQYWLHCEGAPELLFTENETNGQRLWGSPNPGQYVKDAINDAIVHGERHRTNPDRRGTRVAAHYRWSIASGATESILLRLATLQHSDPFGRAGEDLESLRDQADRFYERFAGETLTDGMRLVQRQAFAGLLWSKQFYFFDVKQWLEGDPVGPTPSDNRKRGRNSGWEHLNNADVISMPDTWEYPWYATWDLAFHCVPLAMVDPRFAKEQLRLFLREWYMHPNGQLPAYEWTFDDVNPPVHAWAAWQVYTIDRELTGIADRDFLEAIFHKLLLNFTWWVNRKDREGRNLFQGGFLGLDNIGVFDRTAELPTGGHLEQSDGTAWMGQFCLTMFVISLELARENPVYQDVATKFFEHFLYIAGAINNVSGEGVSLWDDDDQFFYDVLHLPDGQRWPLKVRSLVGLMPLLAVASIERDLIDALPDFRRRFRWFLKYRPALAELVSSQHDDAAGASYLLALVSGDRLRALLRRMLDPDEFLGDFGIRSLSRHHLEHPYVFEIDGAVHDVVYEPGETSRAIFGGNSNWRGPIWFPINFILIESLREFHRFYGDSFLVEHPTGSGHQMTVREIADDLSDRLISIFLRGADGRPVFGSNEMQQTNPHWRDQLLFYEYFHGDDGWGVGASHQTGWTAVIARLLERRGRRP